MKKKSVDLTQLPLINGRCPMCSRLAGTPDARIEDGKLEEYCAHSCHAKIGDEVILKALGSKGTKEE